MRKSISRVYVKSNDDTVKNYERLTNSLVCKARTMTKKGWFGFHHCQYSDVVTKGQRLSRSLTIFKPNTKKIEDVVNILVWCIQESPTVKDKMMFKYVDIERMVQVSICSESQTALMLLSKCKGVFKK